MALASRPDYRLYRWCKLRDFDRNDNLQDLKNTHLLHTKLRRESACKPPRLSAVPQATGDDDHRVGNCSPTTSRNGPHIIVTEKRTDAARGRSHVQPPSDRWKPSRPATSPAPTFAIGTHIYLTPSVNMPSGLPQCRRR